LARYCFGTERKQCPNSLASSSYRRFQPIFVLQPWALVALRSGWRIAAAIPLGFAVPAAIWCLYALAHDSNLRPLVFIFFAPII